MYHFNFTDFNITWRTHHPYIPQYINIYVLCIYIYIYWLRCLCACMNPNLCQKALSSPYIRVYTIHVTFIYTYIKYIIHSIDCKAHNSNAYIVMLHSISSKSSPRWILVIQNRWNNKPLIRFSLTVRSPDGVLCFWCV